ncbi:hypothetical protein ACXO2Y_08835 [Lactobacillus delbrueckii subsp. bulgaricus]|nr:hypothetical protein [Lactobacillus delbrueckii subsp. bulgaricus]MBT8915858.1 hypothetical protein [Lactobacillus delbrueckii subsp. bulgaricus]
MKAEDWAGFSLALLRDIRQIDVRINKADRHLQEGYTKLIGLIESLLLLNPSDGDKYMLDVIDCLDALVDALYYETEFKDPVKRFDEKLDEFWSKW